MSYREYLPSIAPPWMKREIAAAFWAEAGGSLDNVRARLTDGVLARFPGTAAADSQDAIGLGRLLPRAPSESNDDYAARLNAAWTTWGEDPVLGGGAGSHLGMLKALKSLGLPMDTTGATIVQQNGRYSQLDGSDNLVLGTLMDCVNRQDLTGAVPGDLPGWTFEGRDQFYSEFGIVFPEDVVDLTEESPLATALHVEVERWRPGKMVYVGTWVIVTGQTLGWPTGRTLGTEPNLGGNDVRYIPPPGGSPINYYAPP